MVSLEIKDLKKIYNNRTLLNSISFDVNDGEFLSILSKTVHLVKLSKMGTILLKKIHQREKWA